MGVLSDARLSALDERYYDDAQQYRTDEWNERGLFQWEQDLVQESFPSGGRVVVVGCGGGREVLALLKDGYDVVGFESHPALLAFGDGLLTAKGYPSRVRAVPRDAFPHDAGPCDAVIIGWGAYSLVHGEESRINLLRDAYDQLRPDAPILVSFFARPSDHREARWTQAMANGLRRVRGARTVQLGDTLAPNLVHVFHRDEITDEALAAGFEVATYRLISQIDTTISYASAVLRARS